MGHSRKGGTVPFDRNSAGAAVDQRCGVAALYDDEEWIAYVPQAYAGSGSVSMEFYVSSSGIGNPDTDPSEWSPPSDDFGTSELGLFVVGLFEDNTVHTYAIARVTTDNGVTAWSDVATRAWLTATGPFALDWTWVSPDPSSFLVQSSTDSGTTWNTVETYSGSARHHTADGDTGLWRVRAIGPLTTDIYATSNPVSF